MTSDSKVIPDWWVYLIRAKNNSLYCGITTDLKRRLSMHKNGTGAKALRGKGPLEMVWWEKADSKSDALKREIAIKRKTKSKKEALVSAFKE